MECPLVSRLEALLILLDYVCIKGNTQFQLENIKIKLGFPGVSNSKKKKKKKIHPQYRRPGSDPWVGKIPWRRKWQPTPVFLPGEFHGQRNLVGCSPWGHKEWNMAE